MRRPRILVACEYSGTVRDAFALAGWEAWSCDVLPTESPGGNHHEGDVRDILYEDWDLVIAHPPCTFLANSGARWLYDPRPQFANRWEQMEEGAAFFRLFLELGHVEHVAVENPSMHVHARERVGRNADQWVQPWQYGHGETKKTGLWLRNLPPLEPTDIVEGRAQRVLMMPESKSQRKERSRFYPGIARAMADQWGGWVLDRIDLN